ncbi:MAG: hypothetical protein FJ121_11745 [Deltaproteobacteria bacterium]|nr:hypothetical protein [Deltaproteobacteria bacterium]
MITAETIRRALQCDDQSCPCHKPTGHVHCPGHEDTTPSLSITEKNGKLLFYCHGDCASDRVKSALKEKGMWPSGNGDRPQARLGPLSEPTAIYDYHGAKGNLVFQVCRFQTPTGKTFRQRRPDGKGGWVWKMAGVKPVPYRLPEILKADTIYIPEGEKDCNNLAALGLTATCNPMGAGKWRKEYNRHFQGKAVVIIPDNDDAGRKHALDVARNLHSVAASVKVVELPALPEKGDVSDWLNGGATVEQLQALVEAAPEYEQDQDYDQDAEIPGPEGGRNKPNQAEILLKLAGDAELFHDSNTKGFATIEVDEHRETWPIRAKGFKSWLLRRFFQATGKAPGAQAMQDALGVLEAQAHFDGPKHDVFVRVAHAGGNIYIDLANDSWQVVEITPSGWQVVADPPVKFRRPPGLAAMPTPKPGGKLADLRPFINCREEDWPLVVAWILGTFSLGPYPIMIFQGEQGCAKSTAARIMKSVVDPGSTPLRTTPREVRDLLISATNSWCLAFDNLSDLKDWLSDSFCRLATGGGLSTRELYSDADETILDAMRPCILNGIDSMVSRADLADRAILLELPQIPEDERRLEGDLRASFEAAHPGIFGAICDALSAALANFHDMKLDKLPRMADFAVWVVAAEPALPWEPGTFLTAYTRNRAAVVEHSLEGDVVAVAIRAFMENKESWEGTPTNLLNELTNAAGDLVSKGRAWPKAPNSLTNKLKRAATFLRASGFEVERSKSGNRLVAIRKVEEKTVQTVQTVQVQKPCEFAPDDPLDDPKGLDDQTVHLDGPRTILDDTPKRPSTLEATDDKGLDDVDGADDKNQSFSNETMVDCVDCQNFSDSPDGPGGRGYCQLHEKSWDGKIIQFAGALHLCQSFKYKDSITVLAAWDEATAQIVGEAMQALNPEEDLKEVSL